MQGTITILRCLWHQLSLLFYKTLFAVIIFLSLKCFSLFLYGIIDWILKNIPVRYGDGGLER